MITLVVTRFQPAFSPVLRMALRDENSAIRVQAASAMTKVENRFFERTFDLVKKAERNPGDPAAQLALARHYDSYAFAGILDENRENAVRAYRNCLALQPGDLDVQIELARLLVRKGDYSEAVEWLDSLLRRGGLSSHVAAWYMECLFRLARHEDLRVFCRTHGADLIERGNLTPELIDVLHLWRLPEAGAAELNPVAAI
jgi:lipopolysaccharide biosynthesis regulator YciM